jgi:hypothetical protein
MTSLNDDHPGEIAHSSKSSMKVWPSVRGRVPVPSQMLGGPASTGSDPLLDPVAPLLPPLVLPPLLPLLVLPLVLAPLLLVLPDDEPLVLPLVLPEDVLPLPVDDPLPLVLPEKPPLLPPLPLPDPLPPMEPVSGGLVPEQAIPEHVATTSRRASRARGDPFDTVSMPFAHSLRSYWRFVDTVSNISAPARQIEVNVGY